MTLFKGYAEARGFRPIRIPGLSDKIRQQGLTKMRGMEQALAANRRQDANTVRQLERAAAKSKEIHNTNFQLKQGYRDILAKGEWKNFERGIKNEQIKNKNREQDMKALLSLVPTGLKLVQTWDAKRKKDIDEFAHEIYDKYGIGSKRATLIQNYKGNLTQQAMHQEGFLISPNGETLPADVANRIRSMGGYGTLKVHELTAQRIGRNRIGLYLDNAQTKFTIAGQEVNFMDANEDIEDLILTKISAKQREEMGADFPSTNIWHGSGAHQSDVEAKAQMKKLKHKQRKELAVKKQHDNEISDIKWFIGQNNDQGVWAGPVGIQQVILHTAGGPDAPREALGKARVRVISAVEHALKTGQLDWEDVKGLETLEFTPRGSTKPVLWGDHFDKEWFQLEAAGAERSRIENQNALAGPKRRDTEDLTMREKMIELDASEEVGASTWGKFAGIADKKGYTKTKAWIIKQISTGQNAEMDVENGLLIKARMDRNEIVTATEIDLMQFSDTARTQAKQLALANNNMLPKGENVTRLQERIKRELEFIIPPMNSYSSNASHEDAARQAFLDASGHYRTHFEQNGKAEDAYKYARDMITKDIKQPDGLYSPGEVNEDGSREFKGFQADTTRKRIKVTNPSTLKLELGKDQSLLFTKPYISEISIREKLTRLHKGLHTGVLPSTEVIRSITGIPTIDTLLAQREYWANQEIAETGKTTLPEVPKWYIQKARKVESLVNPGPKSQRLLSYYNPVYVNQALIQSGSNPVYTDPLYNKVRPSALQMSGSDYNSIGDGMSSFDAHGFRLIGQTVRTILEIFEAGNLQVAGGYLFTGDQIKKGMETAGLSYDRMFDEKTQDLIFDSLFKTGDYELPPAATGYEALLRDNVVKSLNGGAKRDTTYSWRAPHLVSDKAGKYLAEIGYYDTTA